MPTRDYILVVEDDPDLAEVELMMLRAAGHQAVGAPNGLLALRAVEERLPSLILLDMQMPVMDGWAFAGELRRRHGDEVPIIVVTAAEDAERRAKEIGANGVLAKPFDFNDLLSVVDQRLPTGGHEAHVH